MDYILSKYSFLFYEEGKFFLFNTESLFFTEISRKLFNSLSGNLIEIESIPNSDILLKKKVITKKEEQYNYYFTQKIKFGKKVYTSDILSLTLMPTTGCNFACPYCFEKNKPSNFMHDDIISKLISFIKGHDNARMLDLTWYGGEPLLGFHIIKKILKSLDCEINIPIRNHIMVSNGYLLTDDVIDFFREKKLTRIQITLDGTEDKHNQTRKLKGTNQPTYKRIIENIGKIIERCPETKISIRVNIEASNIDEFIIAYKNLIELYGTERININPGLIRRDNKEGTNFDCGNQLKYQEQLLYLKLNDIGVYDRGYPKHIDKGCTANCLNSYIIGPSGEIYKCWNDVGNASRIIGYIDKEELSNKDLFVKYISDSSCFEDEKCKDCLFFPICSGGCAWYRYRNKYEDGKFDICAIQKDNDMLKKYLLAHYHHLLQKKEAV